RVRLWDLTKRQEMAVLPRMDHVPIAIAFSPDGRKLAVGTQQKSGAGLLHRIVLWDVSQPSVHPRVAATLVGRTTSADMTPWGVAFSPDGSTLFMGYAEILDSWKVSTGRPGRLRKGTGYLGPLEISSDGSLLATSGH